MKVNDLLHKFGVLAGALKQDLLIAEFSLRPADKPYMPRTQWDQQIPLGGENGVYLYLSCDDDVWYIGKGVQAGGGGIGRRACSHLGRYERGAEEVFPYHQWKDDGDVAPDIRADVSKGRFHFLTAMVTPEEASTFVEAAMPVLCRVNDGELPPLNKRMG